MTARGNRRQPIFIDADDHALFLDLLDGLAGRREWLGHGYCLMPNHFHLVVETPAADVSSGMQWLNGRFAQAFNAQHGFEGHVFQGRFHALVIESDAHLLELARYLALNPVRANLCRHPAEWRWSSYRALSGLEPPRRFLDLGRVLALFGRPVGAAMRRYAAFVADAPPDRFG